MADLATYCMPDFSKCGAATNDIGPGFKTAIEFLTTKALTTDVEGTSKFQQDPTCLCWHNLPLCLGSCCLPCCSIAVNMRNMEQMTHRSCESECLTYCALSCCCLYPCYKASVRGEFRKKYNLMGSPCMDMLEVCCFGPCVVCQEGVELQYRTAYNIPHAEIPAEAKYKAPEGKDQAANEKAITEEPPKQVMEKEAETPENVVASAGSPKQAEGPEAPKDAPAA